MINFKFRLRSHLLRILHFHASVIFLIAMLLTSSCISHSTPLPSEFSRTDELKGPTTLIPVGNRYFIRMNLAGWSYATNKNDLPPVARRIVENIEQSGAIVPLFGIDALGQTGIRIIAEDVNMPVAEYYNTILSVNRSSLVSFQDGIATSFRNTDGITWSYVAITPDSKKMEYIEYITRIGQYNLRVTMWTIQSLFESKQQDIINRLHTLEFLTQEL